MDVVFFKSPGDLRKWFIRNHNNADELWIGFYKKSSEKKSVTNAEALDEALCYGWIDGIKNTVDKESYTIRFTPRRATSKWSQINTKHIARLIKEKRMTKWGMEEVKKAKADGRWAAAYPSPANAKFPDDMLAELDKVKNRKGKKFLETLNAANRYAIFYRLHNAKKQETRERWMKRIIEMLNKGEKFH